MKKLILFIFLVLIFIAGCGDGASVTKGGENKNSQTSTTLVMFVGETREVELNLDTKESYNVYTRSIEESKNVSHFISYSNLPRPILTLSGAKAGDENIVVEATDSNGDVKVANVAIKVMSISGDDLVTGTPVGTSSGGTSGTSGSSGSTSGGTTSPPTVPTENKPNFDREACVYAADWRQATDNWTTPEGSFGSDKVGYIRSLMPGNVDSTVTLFYPATTPPSDFNNLLYHELGTYSYTTKNGLKIVFTVQLFAELLGKKQYFYVKSNNYCLRMNIPADYFTPPDTTVEWVQGV